ncbi:hypothetical protein TB1_000836 [Malus domestica]
MDRPKQHTQRRTVKNKLVKKLTTRFRESTAGAPQIVRISVTDDNATDSSSDEAEAEPGRKYRVLMKRVINEGPLALTNFLKPPEIAIPDISEEDCNPISQSPLNSRCGHSVRSPTSVLSGREPEIDWKVSERQNFGVFDTEFWLNDCFEPPIFFEETRVVPETLLKDEDFSDLSLDFRTCNWDDVEDYFQDAYELKR